MEGRISLVVCIRACFSIDIVVHRIAYSTRHMGQRVLLPLELQGLRFVAFKQIWLKRTRSPKPSIPQCKIRHMHPRTELSRCRHGRFAHAAGVLHTLHPQEGPRRAGPGLQAVQPHPAGLGACHAAELELVSLTFAGTVWTPSWTCRSLFFSHVLRGF